MNSVEKEAVLHCLRAMIDEELCEECPLYGTTGTDHCEKDCVRLAINELEQKPCEPVRNPDQLDCVSRQAVLNVIEKAVTKEVARWSIKELPSVNLQPSEDAISRKAVINHICEGKDCYKENCKGVLFNRCMDITWVNELPSVRLSASSSEKPNINEVLDKIRDEIEHMIPCSKETLSMKLGVLEIIDKYKAESEGK